VRVSLCGSEVLLCGSEVLLCGSEVLLCCSKCLVLSLLFCGSEGRYCCVILQHSFVILKYFLLGDSDVSLCGSSGGRICLFVCFGFNAWFQQLSRLYPGGQST
jgi:hypothetical protein